MSPRYYRGWEPLFAPADVVKGPLLVFVPHPDDEVIGCGGLIMAHRDAGQDVTCAIMTDGSLGDFGQKHGEEYPAIREAECRAAAVELGGPELRFLGFQDGGLAPAMEDDAPEPLRRVRELLAERDWSSVAFPSPYELHPDHRATALAVLIASSDLAAPPRLLAYEVGSFMPDNFLLDISGHEARKQAALACYASQLEHHDLATKVNGMGVARTANVDDKNITHCEAWLKIDPERIDEFLAASERLLRLTDGMAPPIPYD